MKSMLEKEKIKVNKSREPLLSYYRPIKLGMTYVVLELSRYFRP
jgi:hypothetical protein